MIEMNKCIYIYIYIYILCLIGLWTKSPKTDVEKLRIERFEVFLNVFAGFVNLGKSELGKSEKQRKLWPIFLKNLSIWKRKEKKNLPLRFRIIF